MSPVHTASYRGSLLVLVTLLATAFLGIAAASVPLSLSAVGALLGVASLPGVVLLIAKYPSQACGLLIFLQIFEEYEFQTPFLALTLGTGVLGITFSFYGRSIFASCWNSTRMRGLLILVLIFACLHVVQIAYQGAAAARIIVTYLSFVLFWMIGAWIGSSRDRLKWTVIGASATAVVLCTLGILATFGVVPEPRLFDPPTRSLMGFTSPFYRSQGLDVSVGATGLMVAIWAPGTLIGPPNFALGRIRLSRLIAFFVLSALVTLVFQNRVSVLSLLLLVAVVTFVYMRSGIIQLAFITGISAFMIPLLRGLVEADTISSSLRSQSYSIVIDYARENPRTWLFGAHKEQVLQIVAARSQFSDLIGYAPIHNVFLDELISAGGVAVLCLALLFIIPAKRAWSHRNLSVPNRHMSALVLGIIAVNLTVVMVFPMVANVAALWISLGIAASLTAYPHNRNP